jgi:hypothetical protein
MGMLKFLTPSLALLLIQACSPAASPEPPAPPAKTVFDPLTQQLDKAKGVRKTVEQNAENTDKALDSQERGDSAQ